LTGGGSLQGPDAARWDAWRRATGQRDTLVLIAQQSWRWTLASVATLVVLLVGMAVWGVPWLGRLALVAIPPNVDSRIGAATLSGLDRQLLQPSTLDSAQQQHVRDALERVLRRQPAGSVPMHTLVFRNSRIGPNAFALPGGTLVMTDPLVRLFTDEPDVLAGVLAHELGHVKHRHGMRMVVQASVIGLLSTVVLGDFSSVLAGAPVLLGQQSYSRAAEREADAHCAAVLKAADVAPSVMVGFFEKINASRSDTEKAPAPQGGDTSWLGIAIASHPSDAERIAFFRAADSR
jgi:Zn-dependent protease with chaperone function